MRPDPVPPISPTRSSADRINWLNAALMIGSCAAAFAAPFHVFLFAYAVLGPAHYLTEISWLHDRSYFAKPDRGRQWWLALVAVAIAIAMYGYATDAPPALEIGAVYLVAIAAILLGRVRSRVNVAAILGTSAIALAFVHAARLYGLVAYFLITIVHVFVFTAAFVLIGAIRSRSVSALVSLAVMLLCAALCFVAAPAAIGATPSVRESYAFFTTLNRELMRIAGFEGDVFTSRGGLAVMRFIAFAYTYHYLNWFSKTSVIKWHEVPRSRGIAVAAGSVAAVALYAWNFQRGIAVLYLLSMLHVLLELPLNVQTFAALIAPGRTSGPASSDRSLKRTR